MLSALLVVIMVSPQEPADSAAAMGLVRRMVQEHYLWAPRINNRSREDYLEWWEPAPRRSRTSSCQAASVADCLGGDWSCRAPIDCVHPDQARRRANLIQEMERVAPDAGGSDYVFRQRVAFAVKNGELERARRIANECFGTTWWCMMLRGFVEHHTDPGSGLAAFDSALALAPRTAWCSFRNAGTLGPAAPACTEPDSVHTRFWWLADPLWSRPGNERRAEHMARLVKLQLEADLFPQWIEYCDVSDYLNSGFPNSYSRRYRRPPETPEGRWVIRSGTCSRPAPTFRLTPAQVQYIMHEVHWTNPTIELMRYAHGGYGFVPDSARFHLPLQSTPADWEVEWDRGVERIRPRERYHNLTLQAVVLRRGTQLLITAAARLPAPLDTSQFVRAHLMFGRVSDLQVIPGSAYVDDAGIYRGSVSADTAGYVASIEVVGVADVARARFGLIPPSLANGFGLSDIALVDSRFEAQSTPLEASLKPSLDIDRREPVGLYFEIYGVADEEEVEITLTGEPLHRSFMQRLFGGIGLGSARTPLHVTWREAVQRQPAANASRFVLLDTVTLPNGLNRVILTVTRGDGTVASVSRLVDVHE